MNLFKLYAEFCENRNVHWLVPIVTGLIAVSAGVALMYVLPPYIVSILNQTGLFTSAQITAANSAIQTVQALGFLVVVIGLLWIVIGIVSASGKKGGA